MAWRQSVNRKDFRIFIFIPRVFYMFSDVFPSFTTFQSTSQPQKTASVPRCEKTPTSWLSPKERLLDILSFFGGKTMLRFPKKEWQKWNIFKTSLWILCMLYHHPLNPSLMGGGVKNVKDFLWIFLPPNMIPLRGGGVRKCWDPPYTWRRNRSIDFGERGPTHGPTPPPVRKSSESSWGRYVKCKTCHEKCQTLWIPSCAPRLQTTVCHLFLLRNVNCFKGGLKPM